MYHKDLLCVYTYVRGVLSLHTYVCCTSQDENECLPFPNEEKEFTLPDDYGKHKPAILSPKLPLSPKEEGTYIHMHVCILYA